MKRTLVGTVFLGMISLFSFSIPAQADVFEIYLFYDQGRDLLNFDETKSPPVVVNADRSIGITEFDDPPAQGVFEYTFFDVTGAEMFSVQFTPLPGYSVVDLPYFSIAKTIKIRRTGQGEYFLQKDISSLVSCNANGICEFEKKENFSTCIFDCASDNVQFSEETKKLLKQNNDVIKDPKTGDVLLRGIQPVAVTPTSGTTNGSSGTNTIVFSISAIVLVLVGIGVWILVKLRKRNREYGL